MHNSLCCIVICMSSTKNWMLFLGFLYLCLNLSVDGNLLTECECTFCWMVECFCSMSLFSLAASTTSWSNCKRQNHWLDKLNKPPGHTYLIQNSIRKHLRCIFRVFLLRYANSCTGYIHFTGTEKTHFESKTWMHHIVKTFSRKTVITGKRPLFRIQCVYACVCMTPFYFTVQSREYKWFKQINNFSTGHIETRPAFSPKQAILRRLHHVWNWIEADDRFSPSPRVSIACRVKQENRGSFEQRREQQILKKASSAGGQSAMLKMCQFALQQWNSTLCLLFVATMWLKSACVRPQTQKD